MFNAAVRPIAMGIGAGVAVGSLLAVPSVMHDLEPTTRTDGLSSGLARAFAGFASNLALPAALLIASAGTRTPMLRHGLQAAAAGVTMGWWGTKAFGDIGPEGPDQAHTR